ALYRYSGGDARKLLNILDIIIKSEWGKSNIVINNNIVINALQENITAYDKNGEFHYDIISAFIKSVRGSDPNGALYWMARMLEGGEDPLFIARRMIILASEDIGLANPNGLLLAQSCFEAVHKIGMPEARIILSQTAIYLATSPKSNSAYMAIDAAFDEVRKSGDLPVPLHLRNAPTKLMKELDYGKDYKYSHSYPGNFVDQDYLPKEINSKIFYNPSDNNRESEISKRLQLQWKKYNNS
ncbi:MAG: replication-associated recombination protein A, partial [Bacteroidia bacterium]|nr:replication-associated recombination protein A [Bacteroidia bacterium]